ncbi:kinase suppressor of Ras (KSR) [Trichuris trichiura]|uniref:Kinase suppressor of Ras (KSR) n=1 Tax=Trichuris trichiura TaxID=36087 RepID=A0A077ZC36_TRITR|nr:kinase suppressor of Ras (KSR) [Trichuris trichiura]
MNWLKAKGIRPKRKGAGSPFSKTFFSVPKRCGYCKKVVMGIGFACKNCRFRCHKRCVMSDEDDGCLKPKLCSLSRVPSGDEEMFGRLMKESEINSNDMDVFLENGLNLLQGNQCKSPEELAQQAASAWSLPIKGPVLRKGDISPQRLLISQEMTAPQFKLLCTNKADSLAQRQLHSQVFGQQLLKVKSLWEEGALQAKAKVRSRSAQDRFDSPASTQLNFTESTEAADSISGVNTFTIPCMRRFLAATFCLANLLGSFDFSKQAKRAYGFAAPGSSCILARGKEALSRSTIFDDGSFKSSNRLSDLREWTISSDDLSFDECILDGKANQIYKGRWHGAVMINIYKDRQTKENMDRFLEEVSVLNNIRHENIVLFMGVVMEPALLAVVTSVQNGDSLYNSLHVKGQVLSQASKLSIARQVAQVTVGCLPWRSLIVLFGMSYMHSRGIVLRHLTSKNIMLESKVKISTIDFGVPLVKCSRWNKGSVRRGNLTYVSPELMRCLHVDPPEVLLTGPFSKESDVYAFGTIVFELFICRFPHADLSADELIWFVCSGRNTLTSLMGIKPQLESLITKCWSVAPQHRPLFPDVVRILHEMVKPLRVIRAKPYRSFFQTVLQSTESVSVPSNINLAGAG